MKLMDSNDFLRSLILKGGVYFTEEKQGHAGRGETSQIWVNVYNVEKISGNFSKRRRKLEQEEGKNKCIWVRD